MSKNMSVVIGIIVVVVVLVGGYAVIHKSSNKTSPSSSYSYSTPSSTGSSSNSSKASSVNNAVLTTKSNSSLGQYLTNPTGMALYTYGGDSAGVSNCTGSCLSSWPAYQDKGATTGLPTDVATIKRTDNGETQYTYKGLPLYTFVGDSQGRVTGNGVSSFQVARP